MTRLAACAARSPTGSTSPLECIRRHYRGEDSPLADILAAQADFFALFEDFAGYVDFWLLQDLVEDGRVRFWLPFDDFQGRAVPQDVASYLAYSQDREEFITVTALI